MGRGLVLDDLHSRPHQLLCAALPAGSRRSRVLPGHDPLPEALVPGQRTGAGRGLVHDRQSLGRRYRQPDFRRVAGNARRRAVGMAMAIPHGRSARDLAGNRCVLGAGR